MNTIIGVVEMAYSIIVSLVNRQLYLVQDGKVIKTYPVGIGKMVTATPTGHFKIINKAPNPGGPYGAMWMGLSRRGEPRRVGS